MTHAELIARREGADLEMKAAQGRNGRGALPRSIWETYSAMANTGGGEIVLGIEEAPGVAPSVLGVAEPERVIKALWDGLNDRHTVSANLLQDRDVDVLTEGGRHVVRVVVPRAGRRRRPVYLGRNPFEGTYRRAHEGDYRCNADEVRRMIADAEHDTLDARIFPHYDLDDLDPSSLASYRNEFRSANPDHVWLTYDDRGMLEQLGGWRRDRASGEIGLTLAGLLMFGRLRPILDNVPHYVLDYRETAPEAERWADRVTTDGSWPGNLYAFYRRAFARLTTELRVPFRTEAGRRVDETPVHRALKEALVNALIHADYSGTTPILVEKGRNGFSFRNPGTLRLPPETIRAGGTSDCRNRNLQKMFQMIGSAEQAGSGRVWLPHHLGRVARAALAHAEPRRGRRGRPRHAGPLHGQPAPGGVAPPAHRALRGPFRGAQREREHGHRHGRDRRPRLEPAPPRGPRPAPRRDHGAARRARRRRTPPVPRRRPLDVLHARGSSDRHGPTRLARQHRRSCRRHCG